MIQITPPQNPQYWINQRALTFSENDLENVNRIAVSLVSGTVIMVYEKGVIDYAPDGNFQKWTLKGYSTRLVSNSAHHIYARLSRTEKDALIVFSINNYNIDGSITTIVTDENGNPVLDSDGKEQTTTSEPNPNYWYVKIGKITATVSNSNRELTYDSGALGTKKGEAETGDWTDMFELSKQSTPWLIFVKQMFYEFTVKNPITLLGGLIFKNKNGAEKPVLDIRRSVDSSDPDDENYVPIDDTTIPTTAWVESRSEDRYLKKYEPDETQHRIKFFDGIEAGTFVKGMLGGSGTLFDGDGYGEMNGLTLREFLEVPELRFNRIDVVSGELWNSVAFGLVESVDTENQICTLKLEGRERSGLQVNDICRGIFADFGDGTQWEGIDECGFLHLYGFWTAYFTPTEILENDEGVFRFRYALKPGTTQHPTAAMKFAVYGNFDDEKKERQASAYSTRSYKRYLNDVNTWVINPDKNIFAQFGDLEGLTIGGMTMHGYGSYLHNTYATGVYIQFSKEQKEELQGEDAYSASLSDYVGIVRMSSDGTIIGGEYASLNVISGEENVVADGENVVTGDYLLKTHVQAFKGTTELVYADTVSEGSYIVSISPMGCEATIENGVISVSKITSMEYSYIKVNVNCEGNAVLDMTYQIKLVKDGENSIYADLDNEMDAVACDKNGKVLFGLPVTTRARMYAGTTALPLDGITVSAPEGVEVSGLVDPEDDTSGIVTVTGITDEAEKILPVSVFLSATRNGQQHVRQLTFTVAKQMQGENGVIYKLLPSSTAVKVDRDNTTAELMVSCKVTKHDGLSVTAVAELPEGFYMTASIGSGEENPYEYGSSLTVVPEDKEVTFRLYNESGEVVDLETVPILLDGNSAFKSTVFIRTNEEPGIPTGGSYEDPKPTSEPTWFDGIPRGEEMLWASTRIFSIDGLYPQQSEWSEPVQMTDTADFDVEFSSVQVNPGNPDDNPDNWSDAAKTDTWWMATRTKKNGVWGAWSISQIKGEKGSPAVMLKIVPDITCIKVDTDGKYANEVVHPSIVMIEGDVEDSYNYTPSGYTLYYRIDDATDIEVTSQHYQEGIDVTTASEYVLFTLYNSNNAKVDSYMVPVLKDGEKGEFTSIFSLNLSSTTIKVNKDGSYSPDSMTATVVRRNGTGIEAVEDPSQHGYSVKMYIDGVVNNSFTYGEYYPVTNAKQSVRFELIESGEVRDAEDVSVLYDGTSALVADLTNDTISVACDKDGNPIDTISSSNPLTTMLKVYFGLEERELASLSATSHTGISINTDVSTGLISITEFTSAAADSTQIKITTEVEVDGTYKVLSKVLNVNKVKKGENGGVGPSADYYIVEASVASIGFSVTGSYSPSSFIVSEYHIVGGTKTASNIYYLHIYGVKDGNETYLTYSTSVNQYTFNAGSYLSRDYDTFIFRLRETSNSTSKIISETSVSIARKGAAGVGQPGAAGAMARYCGVWDVDVTYEYNDEYRDIVIYDGQVYQVATKDSSVKGQVPSESPSYWEKANKTSFVAMDTALIDSANIAGFVFRRLGYDSNGSPVGELAAQSQNSNVSWSNNGSWSTDGIYRKSAVISGGGFTKEIVTFTASENTFVNIKLAASSEANFDYGFVGALDTTYTTRNAINSNYLLRVSGTEIADVLVPVPAGTHTIEIIYSKDSSGDKNDDCVRYYIDSPKLMLNAATGAFACSDVTLSGVINATGGLIGGFTIDKASISASAYVLGTTMDMVLSPQNIQYSYSDGLAAGVSMDAVFGPVQTSITNEGTMTSGVKISNATGKSSAQIGLHLAVKSGYNIFAEGGSCFLLPSSGNMTRIQGLSLYGIKNQSGTVASDFDFIKATGNITLPNAGTLPGKIIFVKMKGNYSISSSSTIYKSSDSGSYTSDSFNNRALFFISDGTSWYEFTCYTR